MTERDINLNFVGWLAPVSPRFRRGRFENVTILLPICYRFHDFTVLPPFFGRPVSESRCRCRVLSCFPARARVTWRRNSYCFRTRISRMGPDFESDAKNGVHGYSLNWQAGSPRYDTRDRQARGIAAITKPSPFDALPRQY